MQRGQIKVALDGGIRGKEHLEAAVEEEAIGALIGAYTPADGIRRLEHADRIPRLRQDLRAGEARQTGADYQDHVSALPGACAPSKRCPLIGTLRSRPRACQPPRREC